MFFKGDNEWSKDVDRHVYIVPTGSVVPVCIDLPTHAVIQYRCRELFGKLHRRLPVAQNSLVDPIDTFKLLATRRFRA